MRKRTGNPDQDWRLPRGGKFSTHLCVCVCVCAHVHKCVHTCVFQHESEICAFQSTCEGERKTPGAAPHPPPYSNKVFLVVSLLGSPRLAVPWASGESPFSAFCSSTGMLGSWMHNSQTVMQMLGIRTQVLTLIQITLLLTQPSLQPFTSFSIQVIPFS